MVRLARPLKKKLGSKLLWICFATIFLTCVHFVGLFLKPWITVMNSTVKLESMISANLRHSLVVRQKKRVEI